MTTGSEVGRHLDDAPRPLAVRGVPVDPSLRIMAAATLVNTFGNSALMITFALYFTRVVGLRPTQVGLAFSAGAFAGLLVQVPAGHLADLRGPRKVLQTLTFAGAVVIAGPGVRPVGVGSCGRDGGHRDLRQWFESRAQRLHRPSGRGRAGGCGSVRI